MVKLVEMNDAVVDLLEELAWRLGLRESCWLITPIDSISSRGFWWYHMTQIAYKQDIETRQQISNEKYGINRIRS